MKLSKRLMVIASMIPEGKRVIDVGCDHGLLDIYLTKQKKNICIASDISANVLINTKEMIQKYHLEAEIQIIQSDGLENIPLKKDDVVVIAGMGTATIKNILEKKTPSYLVIGSHTDLYDIRSFLVKKGYQFVDENTVFEKNIDYVVMALEKKSGNFYNETDLLYGPILSKKREPQVIEYFKRLNKKKKELLFFVPENHIKYQQMKNEIDLLENVIHD